MLCANLRTVLTLAPQCWPLFIFTTGALRSQKLMDSSKLAFQGAPRSHLTLPFPYAGIASTRHHTQVFFKYNIVFTLWEFHTYIKPISIIFTSHTPHSKSSWMPPPRHLSFPSLWFHFYLYLTYCVQLAMTIHTLYNWLLKMSSGDWTQGLML